MTKNKRKFLRHVAYDVESDNQQISLQETMDYVRYLLGKFTGNVHNLRLPKHENTEQLPVSINRRKQPKDRIKTGRLRESLHLKEGRRNLKK